MPGPYCRMKSIGGGKVVRFCVGGKKAKYVQKVSNTPVGFIQDRGKKGGEAVDKEKAAAAQKKQAKLDRIAAAKERAASK